MNNQEIVKQITSSIIEQLEAGVAPWVKPWSTSSNSSSFGAPCNPSSGTKYRGINWLWLTMLQAEGLHGSSNEWITYKQAQAMGAQVRKGAKGVTVCFYKPLQINEVNASGDNESKTIPMLKTYTVFNADFVDGLPVDETIAETIERDEFQTIEECEAFILESGAIIKHGGDRAFYMPSADHIQLPGREAFKSTADYYATALHELSHWTGHKSRLDRDFSKSKKWGDSAYAFEELVAELSAAMLCSYNRIDGKLQHASYIESWLKVLKSDHRAIFKAAAEAQKVLDFLTVEQVEFDEQLAA